MTLKSPHESANDDAASNKRKVSFKANTSEGYTSKRPRLEGHSRIVTNKYITKKYGPNLLSPQLPPDSQQTPTMEKTKVKLSLASMTLARLLNLRDPVCHLKSMCFNLLQPLLLILTE